MDKKPGFAEKKERDQFVFPVLTNELLARRMKKGNQQIKRLPVTANSQNNRDNMSNINFSYHKAADKFLKAYFDNNAVSTIFFSYRFISYLAKEAKSISKSVPLKDMDYQNAVVATWFMYAGVTDIDRGDTTHMTALLNNYFNQINYPAEERLVVEDAVMGITADKHPGSKIQEVVSDAVYSQFALPNFLEDIRLLKEEVNRLTGNDKDELFYLQYYKRLFIRARYYTSYAITNYTDQKERNFQFLEKRIRKLLEEERATERDIEKTNTSISLSNKETEDLFRLAFRNYNHLVSVADSKASLLIHVNSIIISVILAFVVSKIERNTILLAPSLLLLLVSVSTIFLSILASRPQKNINLGGTKSRSYQSFFFGSFDLTDPSFCDTGWDEYYHQLNQLFTSARETVYLEIYKESYNVRKVLSKKFTFLSIAYWVFIVGLLVSLTAFVIAIQAEKVIR